MKRINFIFLLLFLLCLISPAQAADDPIAKLTDLTLSYFTPLYGSVTAVEGVNAVISLGEKNSVRPGMRMKVMREGAPFLHPVTKEPLGKIETPTGKLDIREVQPLSATALVVEGDARQGDKVRISETRVRLLFCQDKSIDWFLADEYYRKLKASGRIEMIDTSLETADEKKVLEEAKNRGAEVALILTAKEAEKGTLVRERLYWVSDGGKFVDTEMKIGVEYSKELKFGEELFAPRTGEAVMMFDLSYGATLITAGDVDGDGTQEIVISNGRDIRVYQLGAELKLLWEIKGPSGDDHIWLDTVDLNKNNRAEIVVTSLKGSDLVSYIYELADSGFRRLWAGNYFLRRLGSGLIAQAYSGSEGFGGDILAVVWNNEYRMGDKIIVPRGINVYDFVPVEGGAGEKLFLSYDEKGFLNLYDEKGTRIWVSSSDNGGFLKTFKKPPKASYMESESWAVKDRLFQRQREVMAVQRISLSEMVRGIGYKSSRIRSYWWNGLSMEEGVLLDSVKGTLLDYVYTGDKIAVLASPVMGLKFGNILKGENPLGTILYIYSVKGR
ncbi:MAG: VCBS repeat-containing protein [Nitrospirae bacterium]|nr:VCBS repeat-containing protein [Nitrospirota bacterium]